METLGHPTFVIGLRFKNILAFAAGRMRAWSLTNHVMMEDRWDYVHITTWNFLPFLLQRVGAAPAWVIKTILAVWCTGTVTFITFCMRLALLFTSPSLAETATRT